MKLVRRFPKHALLLAVAAAALILPGAASAQASPPNAGAVFVQTGNVSGNQIAAYDRAPDGSLTLDHTYDTGGLGGALDGAVVDLTASQGSLTYDQQNRLLYAVNAGSDTISVFAVRGEKLQLRQVIDSHGDFPVSVAAKHGLVYVLNARGGGNVHGYRVIGGRLASLPGSTRDLGLDANATPEFTHTPGQVGFSPRGSQLIVTTKANTHSVLVYDVRFGGRLSAAPVVNEQPGAVPFAFDFDWRGNLAVAQAGTGAVTRYRLAPNGTLSELDSVTTGGAAVCWIVEARGVLYASNTGSDSISGIRATFGGLSLIGDVATDEAPIDTAVTRNQRFLYAQTGKNGIVDAFRINPDGSLTAIGNVLVANSIGGEGIVAL